MAEGFFHEPKFVDKIDAAVRVTDDEIRVWSYGKLSISDDRVYLFPDGRVDSNFRGP